MDDKKYIRTCSIWRALETIGDTSTLLILEASWMGARRFADFKEHTSLLQALLSDRLKRLVAAGVFDKVPYGASDNRYEYRMTRKGRDLYWTAIVSMGWEQKWQAWGDSPIVQLRHRACGHEFSPLVVCETCDHEIKAREVDWSEGPGAGWMTAQYSRRRQQRYAAGDRSASTRVLNDAIQILGDRWATLILRSAFTGLRRYDEILNDTGMATNILSERLSWLVEKQMLKTEEYDPVYGRQEYRLTEKALDYYSVLLTLLLWGDTYYVSPEGPPLLLRHKTGDHPLRPAVVCSHCREAIRPEDVDYVVERSADEVAAQ